MIPSRYIGIILIFSLLSGCSAMAMNEGETDMKKRMTNFENAKKNTMKNSEQMFKKDFEGVVFDLPAYFQKMQPPESSSPIQLYLINEDNSSFNVTAEDVPSTMTLEEYTKESYKVTGYDYIKQRKLAINGVSWAEAISNHNGLRLNQKTMLMNGKAYIFTYGALPENYDKYASIFEKMIQSVEVSNLRK